MKNLINDPVQLLSIILPGCVALLFLYDRWGDELQKLWLNQLSTGLSMAIMTAVITAVIAVILGAIYIFGMVIYALSSVFIEDIIGKRVLRWLFKRHDEARQFKESQQEAERLRERIQKTQLRSRRTDPDDHPGLGAWCRDLIREKKPELASDIALERAKAKCFRSLALLFLLLTVLNLGTALSLIPPSKYLPTNWVFMFVFPVLLTAIFLFIFHKYDTKVTLRTYHSALRLNNTTGAPSAPSRGS